MQEDQWSRTRRALLARLGQGALGLAAWSVAPALRAQDRPIRMILPLSVGSGVDTITRAFSPALAQALGQPVVVENQPGAGGIVGTQALVRATPDGLTLGMVSNNHVIFPTVFKSLPFDPLKDITPISVVGASPLLVVVNPQRIPARDVDGVVALLKAKPGHYNHASSGNGTILHLAVEMFLQRAGVQTRHIPYKGVGPMVTDLIGGQVDIGVLSLPSVQTQLQAGSLRAIGVCDLARTPAAPDIPTIAEQGMDGFEVAGWFAAVAPAGLPGTQVQRVYGGLQRAFDDARVKAAMAAQGNTIWLRDPAATAAFFEAERRKYAQVAQAAGLQAT